MSDRLKVRTEELYLLHTDWQNPTEERKKVIKVINSCETLTQLEVCEKYVNLYKKKYKNGEFFDLDKEFLGKKMKLKNGWNNKG